MIPHVDDSTSKLPSSIPSSRSQSPTPIIDLESCRARPLPAPARSRPARDRARLPSRPPAPRVPPSRPFHRRDRASVRRAAASAAPAADHGDPRASPSRVDRGPSPTSRFGAASVLRKPYFSLTRSAAAAFGGFFRLTPSVPSPRTNQRKEDQPRNQNA